MILNLADVMEALTGTRPAVSLPVITEAAVDSRQVIPGALFAALPGEHTDGHAYLADAFQRGAAAALIQRAGDNGCPTLDLRAGAPDLQGFDPEKPCCLLVTDVLAAVQKIAAFWRRKLDLRVIGITGSVGKSTTKELVAEVLSQRFRTLKNPGNLNNEIGLPLTILKLGSGYQVAVLEMGFYVPGEIKQLCDIALPQVGILTNIGTVHAERAGSQEAIARGKSELVTSLPAAPQGSVILNHDDPWIRPMAELTRARVFYYGMTPQADLWADQVVGLGLEGISLRLHFGRENLHVRVPMIGQHSVHTVLRAAAAGLVEGLSWQEILNGLRSGNSQLRLVAVRSNSGALLLDDTYNASPESTLAALSLLSELEGRKVAVLGDMLELGPYERQGHAMVGVRAAQVAALLVTVGELGRLIAESARQAGMPADCVVETPDTDRAIAYLKKNLGSNDAVLVKGSHGIHMEQIVSALEIIQ